MQLMLICHWIYSPSHSPSGVNMITPDHASKSTVYRDVWTTQYHQRLLTLLHSCVVRMLLGQAAATLLCRKWSEFVKDLAPSIECMSNTGIPGKNSRAPVPGSKLFSTFQASEAQRGGASHFTELGGLLMHTQHGSSTVFGTCNVMVSSQTLRTQARPEATEEILFKLTNGYNKGLWPVLHLDEPSDHLVMPSDAADHASRKYLGGRLQQASSTINSGEGASLLPGNIDLTLCVVQHLHILCSDAARKQTSLSQTPSRFLGQMFHTVSHYNASNIIVFRDI